jgi:hypothetical protein
MNSIVLQQTKQTMNNMFSKKSLAFAIAAFVSTAIVISACKKDKNKDEVAPPATAAELKDFSVNPSLLKSMAGFENLKITTLISSDDVSHLTLFSVRSRMEPELLKIHPAKVL